MTRIKLLLIMTIGLLLVGCKSTEEHLESSYQRYQTAAAELADEYPHFRNHLESGARKAAKIHEGVAGLTGEKQREEKLKEAVDSFGDVFYKLYSYQIRVEGLESALEDLDEASQAYLSESKYESLRKKGKDALDNTHKAVMSLNGEDKNASVATLERLAGEVASVQTEMERAASSANRKERRDRKRVRKVKKILTK